MIYRLYIQCVGCTTQTYNRVLFQWSVFFIPGSTFLKDLIIDELQAYKLNLKDPQVRWNNVEQIKQQFASTESLKAYKIHISVQLYTVEKK